MSVQTVLLDFSIDASRISDEESRKDVIKLLQETLKEFFPSLATLFQVSTADGHLILLSEDQKNFLNVRLFDDGIITLNIEYFKKDNEEQLLSFDVSAFGFCDIISNRKPLPFFPLSDDQLDSAFSIR